MRLICLILLALSLTASAQIQPRVMSELLAASIPRGLPNVTSGLVAWWTFDESSGDAFDSSAGGVVLTNYSAGRTNGIANNASLFNGSNYLNTTNVNGSLNVSPVTNNFSFSLWIYANIPKASEQTPFVKTCNTTRDAAQFGVDLANTTGKAVVYMYESNPYALVSSTSDVPTNTWTHVAVTYNLSTSNAIIFINGISNNNGTATSLVHRNKTGQQNLSVGAFNAAGSLVQKFQGAIDDLRVYNRTLTPSEITTLYNWRP